MATGRSSAAPGWRPARCPPGAAPSPRTRYRGARPGYPAWPGCRLAQPGPPRRQARTGERTPAPTRGPRTASGRGWPRTWGSSAVRRAGGRRPGEPGVHQPRDPRHTDNPYRDGAAPAALRAGAGGVRRLPDLGVAGLAVEFLLTLRLAPGDCLVFDNTRVLHARTAFAPSAAVPGSSPPGNPSADGTAADDAPGGIPAEETARERHLQGCYADIDGLLSTLAVLRRVNRASRSPGELVRFWTSAYLGTARPAAGYCPGGQLDGWATGRRSGRHCSAKWDNRSGRTATR